MPASPCAAAAAAVLVSTAGASDTCAAATPAPASRRPRVPVVRVAAHLVFGVSSGWCIVTCPVCDRDGSGFIQEDVHALPPAASTCCAYGHAYHIELDT
jgi:hypothetical protein